VYGRSHSAFGRHDSVYGRSIAAPQVRKIKSPPTFRVFFLFPFNFQLSTSFLHLLFHYFFTLAFPSHLFSLTAAVCSNEPTVLHPLSVFSNLCETSYPHPRTGHTQNLTFRPTAKSPI